MRTMRILVPLLMVLLGACGKNTPENLCQRFFSPYPDHISGRERTNVNAPLLDAMSHYAKKEYAEAIPLLQKIVERDMRNSAARMYLINALLAEGDPYKAEMHLDFMENYKDRNFKDQVEWYNALSWLCEGNTEMAMKQAQYIAAQPHTYRKQAAELAKALEKR